MKDIQVRSFIKCVLYLNYTNNIGSLSNMIKTKLAKFEEDLEKSKKRHNIKREISLKSLIKNVKRNELGDYWLSHKLRNSSNMLRESWSQNLSIKLASNENSIIKHHRNDSRYLNI